MSEPTFGTFFLPGPTEVREPILRAMLKPMIPHRSEEFEQLYARIQTGIKPVFRTSEPVLIAACSATGMMESAIRCAPSGRILALVNGAFSERFAHIAAMCGREVDRYEVAWGQIHAVPQLEDRLAARKYGAITVAHSETSTGALNDVRALSDAAHRHRVTCIIDSVSGLCGAELRFDEWKLDFVLTGSQKAFALPPGLGFAVASPAFVEQARAIKDRGVYFDIVELDAYARKNQTPSTPAVSLMYALEAQLTDIADEGMDARWERHRAMAAQVQQWVAETSTRLRTDLANIAPLGAQSPTVSTIRLPAAGRGDEFVSAVAERGIRIGGGYGKLRSSTFRIGHMGDHTTATIDRCLAACASALSA